MSDPLTAEGRAEILRRCQNSCPSCGRPHDTPEELEAHDWIACWNKTMKCPGCGGIFGYDWESDPEFKICMGCGYKWSKI